MAKIKNPFKRDKKSSKKLSAKQIKKLLIKLFLALLHHPLWACLLLFFLALVFGALVFYKYNILAQRAELDLLEKPVLLKESAYQNVLGIWQENEKRFEETDNKEYPDPFQKTSLPPEAGEEEELTK